MRVRVVAFLALMAIAFLTGYAVRRPPTEARPGQVTPVSHIAYEEIESSRVNAIVAAARRVAPAVVSISVIQTRYYRSSPSPGNDYWDRFFRDIFPPRIYSRRVHSLGSGFIVDTEGHVLTNEHVVRNAEEIRVTLPDGREFAGTIRGMDETIDIALLKVDGVDLPVAPLGNSDQLVIGEWAIAIGNPFGYLLEDPQPSVTAGVISAFHRDIKPKSGWVGMYKDMIQTDAAINPGNSGGPLVNAEGEVIGINTFIFTAGGGSEGIGFAIPINSARKIMRELAVYGEVREVWLGLEVQELNERLIETIRQSEGVLVTDVEESSSAEVAGVQVGDLIIQLNARKIRDYNDWEIANSCLVVDEEVRLKVLRDHQPIELTLRAGGPPTGSAERRERLGLVVEGITSYLKNKFKLEVSQGVVVVDVREDSPGQAVGVELGDVILALESEEIRDLDDFERAADMMGHEKLSLLVDRKGTRFYLSYTSAW